MELDYKIHNYAWGKQGLNSKVASLYKNAHPDCKIDDNLPYAELWLGTHINGPSTIKNAGISLGDLIQKHPEYLGDKVLRNFNGQLPFLFKILSVNKALSIQAHPSKKTAQKLHAKYPDIYKDANHKPELAIALTPFEALCGFRPLSEIYWYLKNVPELNRIVGDDVLNGFGDNSVDLLKIAFETVLTTSKKVIKYELKKMLQRFERSNEQQRTEQCADLIERLHSQYPGDVGCFMVYFLNYLKLEPFEALFLAANVPHAYLYGDCVECMACSDNVVRAGLTPKLIDVKTLCSILDYKSEIPERIAFQPIVENEFCRLYKPPVQDFAVVEIKVSRNVGNYELPVRQSASTLLVISGKAKSNEVELIPGTAVFLPANKNFQITNILEDLLIYQGLANL